MKRMTRRAAAAAAASVLLPLPPPAAVTADQVHHLTEEGLRQRQLLQTERKG